MYITPDADSHSGGAWQGFSRIKKLGVMAYTILI